MVAYFLDDIILKKLYSYIHHILLWRKVWSKVTAQFGIDHQGWRIGNPPRKTPVCLSFGGKWRRGNFRGRGDSNSTELHTAPETLPESRSRWMELTVPTVQVTTLHTCLSRPMTVSELKSGRPSFVYTPLRLPLDTLVDRRSLKHYLTCGSLAPLEHVSSPSKSLLMHRNFDKTEQTCE